MEKSPLTSLISTTLLVVLAACSQGKSPSSPEDKPTVGPALPPETGQVDPGATPQTGEERPPEENDAQDEPQMVSGAFLTAFGPTAAAAPAGQKAIGASVFQKVDQAKVAAFVEVLKVTYYTLDGDPAVETPHDATVITSAGAGVWHAVFSVPTADATRIARVDLETSVDDSTPIALQTRAFVQYTPEATPTAVPDFTPEGTEGPPPAATVQASAEPHLLFVSDKRYLPGVGGKLTSVREGHRLCNREANLDDELKRYWWKAILSDSTAGAQERLKLDAASVLSLDRSEIVPEASSLLASAMGENALRYGNHAVATGKADDLVWTGSTATGTAAAHCGDWQLGTGTGTAGDPGKPTGWLSNGAADCSVARRIYCISTSLR